MESFTVSMLRKRRAKKKSAKNTRNEKEINFNGIKNVDLY